MNTLAFKYGLKRRVRFTRYILITRFLGLIKIVLLKKLESVVLAPQWS